ncbi:MAG: TonB-dependent receptor [Flavobacteriales bacterium]|nr:TonB-dependent receptor [Flavobacteriales bacterium]
MTFKSILSLSFIASTLWLSAQESDTLIIYPDLEEVNIRALRASEKTPMSYSNIDQQQLEEQNLGQDIPYMLSLTPSIVTTSDAGAGIGYTGFRVRGSDPTRINVTIDGIPLNDAESQGVWWVNMPDFTSSVEDIQIQRGVGTSTNGAGAFGATVNLRTQKLRPTAYATTNNSIGSYNTLKNNVEFGSGLLANKFTLDGRLSKLSSDGYIDRATSDLKSLYLSGAYFGNDEVLKLTLISGKEKTYQAWNGVPLSYINDDSLRTFNSYTYENETDNYWQDHYMMHYNKQLSPSASFNLGLHFTKGRGYYEQYKKGEDFTDYGLNNVIVGSDTITSTNLIRRKWLDNDFYGTVFSYQNSIDNLEYTIGGGWNTYEGRHYGVVRWAEYASNGSIDHIYYDNDAIKTDLNVYAKALYKYSEELSLFGDLQKRYIDYSFIGKDDNGASLEDTVNFDFFNPKFGAFYQLDDSKSIFASFAVANREPNRSDFVDSSPNSRPVHETLYDTELGYKISKKNFTLSANAYYMIYENQLILTGKINDVGEYTRENVDYSERKGIEIEGGVKLNSKIDWSGNISFSENTIANYTEYVDNWDTWGQEKIEYENTNIAFSPELIWASKFNYQFNDRMGIQLISKYVDEQYIDNTSSQDRKLDAYLVHHGRFIWNINSSFFKKARLSLQVNNLLDENYVNNAWIYRFKSDGYDPRPDDAFVSANSEGGYDMVGYFPQAKRNFLLGLTLGF